MNLILHTPRLSLSPLTLQDIDLIQELTNSPEWIRFIGKRATETREETLTYIQHILDNPNVHYWMAVRKEDACPLGGITLIQREYLDYRDIGFAFLSRFVGQGYAYEATLALLTDLIQTDAPPFILATTIPDNINSIKLLERLGFHYERQILEQEPALWVYSMATDTFQTK